MQVYKSTVGKKLAKLWDGRDSQDGTCATWEQYTTQMATDATWVGPLEFCALAAKLDVKVVVVTASAGIRMIAYHLTGTSTMMLWYAESHFDLVVTKKGKVMPEGILNVTTQLPNFTNCRGVGHITVRRISTSFAMSDADHNVNKQKKRVHADDKMELITWSCPACPATMTYRHIGLRPAYQNCGQPEQRKASTFEGMAFLPLENHEYVLVQRFRFLEVGPLSDTAEIGWQCHYLRQQGLT